MNHLSWQNDRAAVFRAGRPSVPSLTHDSTCESAPRRKIERISISTTDRERLERLVRDHIRRGAFKSVAELKGAIRLARNFGMRSKAETGSERSERRDRKPRRAARLYATSTSRSNAVWAATQSPSPSFFRRFSCALNQSGTALEISARPAGVIFRARLRRHPSPPF